MQGGEQGCNTVNSGIRVAIFRLFSDAHIGQQKSCQTFVHSSIIARMIHFMRWKRYVFWEIGQFTHPIRDSIHSVVSATRNHQVRKSRRMLLQLEEAIG